MKKDMKKWSLFDKFWYVLRGLGGMTAVILVGFMPENTSSKVLIGIVPVLFYAFMTIDFITVGD